MRVIIAGGSGLLGLELVNDLATDGHELIVLSRNPANVTGVPSKVRVEQWDGKTAQGWGQLADGADAIINLAGESIAGSNPLAGRWTPARKKAILDSRLNATNAIVEAIKNATKKPALVQASAVGYYGPHGNEELAEDAKPGNDFLANVCMQWEKASEPVEAWGVRRVVFRTGVVLSMAGGALPFMVLPFRMFVGGPLGSGKQWFPWIHIDDETAAIRYFLQNEGAHGVYNLCAPNPLTNADFGKVIGKVLRRPSYMPAPEFVFRLAFGELATLLVDGQHQIPKRLKQTGFRFKFPDAELALKDLLR